MNTKQQIVAAAFLALISAASVRAETIEYSIAAKSVATTASTLVSPARLLQKDVPLTLAAKDLDSTWQFVTLNQKTKNKNDDKGFPRPTLPTSQLEAIDLSLHVAPNVYLTQWQTAASGGQAFLIAYRVAPLIENEKQRAFYTTTEPPSDFATEPEFFAFLKSQADDRPLELTLLNLQTIGVVNSIEPYDVKARDQFLSSYIFISGFRPTPQLVFQSMTNLKQLGIGIMQYAQEYDEVYPPMQSLAALKKAILPYVLEDELFMQPVNKKPYLTNVALSGRSLSDIKSPATFASIYEAQPGSDGKRAVGFADGHVKRVTPAEWTQIKKDSGIK